MNFWLSCQLDSIFLEPFHVAATQRGPEQSSTEMLAQRGELNLESSDVENMSPRAEP
jgi:hypothetical protein